MRRDYASERGLCCTTDGTCRVYKRDRSRHRVLRTAHHVCGVAQEMWDDKDAAEKEIEKEAANVARAQSERTWRVGCSACRR